jgi:predicted RNA-binding Zn-ribbon protein involved in translation (DUF1610 family)
MKVLEHGECYDYELSGKIRCSGCGCLIEYDESDFKEYILKDPFGRSDYRIRDLICPECGRVLITKKELVGE